MIVIFAFDVQYFILYARAVKRKLKGCCGERLFIRLARTQLHWLTTDVFLNISRHLGVPHFLSSVLVISLVNFQKSHKKGETG